MKKETMNERNYSTEKENIYFSSWWVDETAKKKEDLEKKIKKKRNKMVIKNMKNIEKFEKT